MPDINSLIDENLNIMQGLSQEANRTLDGVGQIEQFVTALTESITAKEQEAQQRFGALRNKLTDAEQNLETELQSAKEELKGLREKAGAVESQLEEMASKIGSQLSHLKSHAEEMLPEIEARAKATQDNLSSLLQKSQDFESDADTWEDSATHDIEALRQSVETARNGFNKRQTAFNEQFDTLGQEIGEGLKAVFDDFSVLEKESTNQLTGLDNALNTAANDAIADMHQEFATAHHEISVEGVELVRDLSTLGEAGTDDCERINDRFGEVVDRIADVVAIIQEVIPALDEVEETLG